MVEGTKLSGWVTPRPLDLDDISPKVTQNPTTKETLVVGQIQSTVRSEQGFRLLTHIIYLLPSVFSSKNICWFLK
jgi:hypothetical protein